jgi:ABC-type sugar transport system substrate-binding protein
MKSVKAVTVSAVAVTALLLGGCAASTDGGGGSAKHTIGATTYSRSFEFYQDIEKGMKQEGGDDLGFQFQDPNGDLAAQTAAVEDFIAKGVDLVTMVPIDSDAAAAEGRMVTDAGIPLITVDIAITEDVGQAAHVASDNHGGGEIAAQKMSDLLGGKGSVAVINNPAITSVVDREKGFTEKLAEIAPDIAVVASQSGESKRDKAQSVAEDLIQANPGLTGIFAVNDEMALGALQAVNAAGLQDKISIIGFDASSEGLKEIASGHSAFKASVAQDPVKIGTIVSQTARKVLNGEKVDKVIPVPVILVDSSNYEDYLN